MECPKARRLLIVDHVDRRLYGQLLEEYAPRRFEVGYATCGRAALAMLNHQLPDCVLLDCHLPDMTGIEFLLAAAPDNIPICAVVVITEADSVELAVEMLKYGAQDYVVKNEIDGHRLYQRVEQAVFQRRLGIDLRDTMKALTASNSRLEQESAAREKAEADRKQTEIRIQHLHEDLFHAARVRSLDNMAAVIAHELNQPLGRNQ